MTSAAEEASEEPLFIAVADGISLCQRGGGRGADVGSVRGARRGRLGGSELLLLHKLVSDAGILGLRRRTEGVCSSSSSSQSQAMMKRTASSAGLELA